MSKEPLAPKKKKRAPKLTRIKKKITLSPTLFLSVGSFILSFIALALIFTLNLKKTDTSNRESPLNRAVHQINQRITHQRIISLSQTDALKQSLASQQERLNTVKINLANTLQQINQSQRTTTLDRIAHLLQQAQLQLDIRLSIKDSLRLIQSAQNLLKNLHDDTLFTLSEKLNELQKTLKNTAEVNIPDILFQLNDISAQTKQLSIFINKTRPALAFNKAVPNAPQVQHGSSAFRSLLSGLKQLVIIRHHSHPIQILDDPKTQYYIQIQLQTLIATAQWALLHQQQDIYSNSLKKAQTILAEHFPKQSNAMASKLHQLANQNIEPNLPRLDEAIQLTNQAMSHLTVLRGNSPSKNTIKKTKSASHKTLGASIT